MQKMTKQPPLFALVPVPYEALVDAGIDICEPLQFVVEEGRITMEHIPEYETDNICGSTRRECPRACCNCYCGCDASPCNNKNDENEVY